MSSIIQPLGSIKIRQCLQVLQKNTFSNFPVTMGVPKHYNERMKVENAEYMYECMYEKN